MVTLYHSPIPFPWSQLIGPQVEKTQDVELTLKDMNLACAGRLHKDVIFYCIFTLQSAIFYSTHELKNEYNYHEFPNYIIWDVQK